MAEGEQRTLAEPVGGYRRGQVAEHGRAAGAAGAREGQQSRGAARGGGGAGEEDGYECVGGEGCSGEEKGGREGGGLDGDGGF